MNVFTFCLEVAYSHADSEQSHLCTRTVSIVISVVNTVVFQMRPPHPPPFEKILGEKLLRIIY